MGNQKSYTLTWVLTLTVAYLAVLTWGFATNRIVLTQQPSHYEVADCSNATDPMTCVEERNKMAMGR
jgi:hypothetical protein